MWISPLMHDCDRQALRQIIRTAGGFGHREHLELAYGLLSRSGLEEAQAAMSAALREVAAAHGMPERYHDTLTLAWVQLVAVHRHRWDAETFDAFMARAENRPLLERGLLDGHYSRELLFSDRARAGWVMPDVRALPSAA
jgi:hypothetical protein